MFFVMFCCYLLGACSFQIRGRKEVHPDVRGGEELKEQRERQLYSDYILGEKDISFINRGRGERGD